MQSVVCNRRCKQEQIQSLERHWEGADFAQALLVEQVPKTRPDSEFQNHPREPECPQI